jgi:hypothetical protein
MSHKASVICDRCGKRRPLPSSSGNWKSWGSGDRSIDFCPKCAEQFTSFLKGHAVVACLGSTEAAGG